MKHFLFTLFIMLSALMMTMGQISLVRNIDYGENYSPSRFTTFKSHLYFSSLNGYIYRTDGTAIGTTKVGAGTFDENVTGRCIVGDHLYYGGNAGNGLYRINGITGETEIIFEGAYTPRNMADLNGILLFSDDENDLYRSDGTIEGTSLIAEMSITQIIPNDSVAYIFTTGGQIFQTDGFSVTPLTFTTYPINSRGVVWNDALYFLNNLGNGISQLFKYDNGEFSEILLPIKFNFISQFRFFPTESSLYFFGTSYYERDMYTVSKVDQLWKTDGTIQGTIKVSQLGDNSVHVSNNFRLSKVGRYPNNTLNIFYFVAGNPEFGSELWRSDGTDAGTFMVKDIFPGIGSSHPSELNVIDDVCYFIANDGVHGFEVWRSDGTESGTYMLMDLNPGEGHAGPIQEIFETNSGSRYHFNGYALAHNGRYYLSALGQLYSTGVTPPATVVGVNITQNLGWCENCATEVFQKGNSAERNEYFGFTHGDDTFTHTGRFTLEWDEGRWKGQYEAKHDTTGGIWLSSHELSQNGFSTAPKPPCRGWNKGVTLIGDCIEPNVQFIGNAPVNNDVSHGTYLTNIVNNKNEYSIENNITVKWNLEMLRWELIINMNWGDYSAGEVLSYNLNNNGSNPPCLGWSGDYGLWGDICINYPNGIPDYIYRPSSPIINTYDKARKAILLEPGTVIDGQVINTYRGEIKQN